MARRLTDLGWAMVMAAAGWALPTHAHAATWPASATQGPTFGPISGPAAGPAPSTRYETNGFTVPVTDFPVRLVFLGEPPAGMTSAEVERAARAATAEWTRVPCARARLEYAGRRATLEQLAPGEIPFLFAQPGSTACFPRGVIGWTALTCGPDFPNKTVFLNQSDYAWSAEPRPFQFFESAAALPHLVADVQSVLTHEFGHVLGLAHSPDPLATMTPSYLADGGQSSLALDDKSGLCALYPAQTAADECQSGRDCRPQERCARVQTAHAPVRLCEEFRGAPGDACAPDRLICDGACVFAPDPQSFGYCTVACAPDTRDAPTCPRGFECAEGLIRPGEAHCQRLGGSNDFEEPGCAVQSKTPAAPSGWMWAIGALWLVSRRILAGSRPCSTKSESLK